MKKILLLLSGLCLSSAAFSVDFATEGKKYNDLVSSKVNAVHIVSASLQTQNKRFFSDDESVLSVEYLSSQRTAVNTLEVIAVFRNRSSTPATIEARTIFLGQGGIPINDKSAWQRIFLDANGTESYREKSLYTDQVKHYRIEVRESS